MSIVKSFADFRVCPLCGANREPARAELLQVAAMAAQWAEDLEGDGR